jgi:hypothetical protein
MFVRGINPMQIPLEGLRVGLAPEDRQGKDRAGPTIAKGNDDVAEMDCRAITNGELELCLQPAGRQSGSDTKMKSANSGNPLRKIWRNAAKTTRKSSTLPGGCAGKQP